jgi:hypothetical protein
MKRTSAVPETSVAVMNPRGTAPSIKLVPMAPRPGNLDGKTIYIVDVNFPLTEAFYDALLKLLKERYPEVNWVVRKKSGTTFDDDLALWQEIKEKGHGAIVGPGHMDTLGPAVVGWCLELEKMGVPAAPVIGAAFPDIVKGVAYEKGMPNMRLTFIPRFVARIPEAVCHQFLLGNDPINKKPVLEEIIAALTKPPTTREKRTGIINRSSPRLMAPDTPENLARLFLKNGWTDGLPVALPTEVKVAGMLKGTRRKPDEIVGRMSPASTYEPWSYTVEQVAANAIMAGAGPEHLPVILAIAATGVTALWSSLTSHARMAIVNGPIRQEIKMNSGIGALGPFNQANAVIGRAWTLISKNLAGGGVPGVNYLGTMGNSYNYNNLCCAENEEALPPGWLPLHVQKGFKPEESTISLFRGWTMSSFTAIKPDPRHEIMRCQLSFLETSGTGAHFFPGVNIGGEATLLISPMAAQELVREGFGTKEKLSRWLKDNTFMTMWNYWVARPDARKAAREGVEPFASLLKLTPEASSPELLIKPETPVEVAVVGGETDQVWQAGDFGWQTTVSIDQWR